MSLRQCPTPWIVELAAGGHMGLSKASLQMPVKSLGLGLGLSTG